MFHVKHLFSALMHFFAVVRGAQRTVVLGHEDQDRSPNLRYNMLKAIRRDLAVRYLPAQGRLDCMFAVIVLQEFVNDEAEAFCADEDKADREFRKSTNKPRLCTMKFRRPAT